MIKRAIIGAVTAAIAVLTGLLLTGHRLRVSTQASGRLNNMSGVVSRPSTPSPIEHRSFGGGVGSVSPNRQRITVTSQTQQNVSTRPSIPSSRAIAVSETPCDRLRGNWHFPDFAELSLDRGGRGTWTQSKAHGSQLIRWVCYESGILNIYSPDGPIRLEPSSDGSALRGVISSGAPVEAHR